MGQGIRNAPAQDPVLFLVILLGNVFNERSHLCLQIIQDRGQHRSVHTVIGPDLVIQFFPRPTIKENRASFVDPQFRHCKRQLFERLICRKGKACIVREQILDRFQQAVHRAGVCFCIFSAFLMEQQCHLIQRVESGVGYRAGFCRLPDLLCDRGNSGVIYRQQAGMPLLRRTVGGIAVPVNQGLILQLSVSGKDLAEYPAVVFHRCQPVDESRLLCDACRKLFGRLLQVAAGNAAAEELCLDVDGCLHVGHIGILIMVKIVEHAVGGIPAVRRANVGTVEVKADFFQFLRKLCPIGIETKWNQLGLFCGRHRQPRLLFSLHIGDQHRLIASAAAKRPCKLGIFLIGSG